MSDSPMSENPTPEDIAVFKIRLIKQFYKTAVLEIDMLRSRGLKMLDLCGFQSAENT